MKREKKFDCIQMKDQIHAKLNKEYNGLNEDQISKRIREDLDTSDSPMGKFWRELNSKKKAA